MGESIDFDYLISILLTIFNQLFEKKTRDEINAVGNHVEKVAKYSKKLRELSYDSKLYKDDDIANDFGDDSDDEEEEDEEFDDENDGTCFNSNISKAFNIFFFIETINNATDKYKEKKKQMKDEHKVAYDVFTANSAHIEIEFKDQLHKVYFMIQPACRYLDVNKKEQFMDNVNRGTANEKITDLMASTHGMFDVMDHMSNLKVKCPFVNQSLLQICRDICLIIIAIINFFMLALYEIKVEETKGTVSKWSGAKITLQILGGLHIAFSFFLIILWFILDGRLIITQSWRDLFQGYKKFLMNRVDVTNSKENEVWD